MQRHPELLDRNRPRHLCRNDRPTPRLTVGKTVGLLLVLFGLTEMVLGMLGSMADIANFGAAGAMGAGMGLVFAVIGACIMEKERRW